MATVLKEPGAALNYDMSDASWYVEDRWQEPFRQMRAQDPIHWTENGMFGNFWNVTSHKAIQHVEALPEIFSSSYEHGGITLADRIDDGTELVMPMFIAMDRPKHTGQRRTVAPAFTPTEMKRMSDDIRRRTAEILDGLPWDQPFDWVDKVSIELTTQMLAILFDFPWEDRRKLTEWSDWAGDIELVHSEELRQERLKHLYEMGAYFKKLWDAKINAEPTPDLISMMIHSDAMSEMDEFEFMGNLILLIVGGNDTTRNSMSGLVYGLQQFPDQREKLEQNPELIPNAVQEIIRWQTPLAHMRRTALEDYDLFGKTIKKGDKLALWYISGNRDESVFEDADKIIVDRENARRHLAFGYGIHRCVGARLAELQIAILLEEMAKRRMRVNVLEEPVRVRACFVHGYRSMQVSLSKY
ncbi:MULTISPECIES: cytochrome P450 [Pseudomonadota]|jgi:cytochrome P450|uniref:cytochrome P450 n=1 Tax=Pseudomonadota TaxID=1224 RepID=UPI00076A5C23|nr:MULTISPECIES: cytochrome P450 [Pseudomonadota]MAF61350.1 cytochrome P450 [Blastomonas sp.]|tara:strand:+ start:19180 stop:20418 length:1239 start_codon:yes stop_codon:yes gene_type:complete